MSLSMSIGININSGQHIEYVPAEPEVPADVTFGGDPDVTFGGDPDVTFGIE